MYCDQCGYSLAAENRYCPSCGKPVLGGLASTARTGPLAEGEQRVARHIYRLATLWTINGVLRLLFVLWLYAGGRMFLPMFGPTRIWSHPFFQTFTWGPMLAILGVFGVLHFVLAWGLYQRQPWARFLGLILGFLALIRFPFGTALGIYTIWVLLPESSGREYERLAHAH